MTYRQIDEPHPFGSLRAESARLILAGFQRNSYAGVLTPIHVARGSLHICDLLLDGLGRKLRVKVRGLPIETGVDDARKRSVALHGLPFLLEVPRAELAPVHSKGVAPQFTASIDVQEALLHLSIVPYRSPTSSGVWICVLEILRQEGS